MKFSSLIFFLFAISYFPGQKKAEDSIFRKEITITRTKSAPKIDGILDDEVWKNVPIAKDFVELQPENGKPEASAFRTEVKILYVRSRTRKNFKGISRT
jgi:hypothetical protein